MPGLSLHGWAGNTDCPQNANGNSRCGEVQIHATGGEMNLIQAKQMLAQEYWSPLIRGRKNQYGIINALGNVWEWGFLGGKIDMVSELRRALRGGSYLSTEGESTLDGRWIRDGKELQNDVGFRIVRLEIDE